MPRVMMVVSNLLERNKLVAQFPDAMILNDPNFAANTLQQFRARPDAVLICTKMWAIQGFRVPADTVMLLGRGIDGADRIQIEARPRD